MFTTSVTTVVRFGAFEVSLETGELRHRGQKIKLQEQPFQVLVALLERPGEIVSREDLRKKLWPADTYVDFDHGLNAAIKRLRDALGESAEAPIFIETLARRGYRFIGHIETPSAASTLPAGGSWLARKNIWLFGTVAFLLAMLLLYYRQFHKSKLAEPVVIAAVAEPGEKFTPAVSPDGQHLAFAWNGGIGPHFSIYLKVIGEQSLLRLTKQPAVDFNPVWSPDGRYIAFCRIRSGETGIYIIPALGGVERRLRETYWQESEFREVFWYFGRLAWSPDGKTLAFSDRNSESGPATSIFLLTLDSLKLRRLTSPQNPGGDYNPAFSPDGQTLAFNRGSQGMTSIYTISISGDREQRLLSGIQNGWGLAWAPDGRDIIFGRAGWLANAAWLWKVSARGGEPQRLQFGQEGVQPSIRGNRLAYLRQMANLNIWRRTVNSLSSVGPAERFISSTKMETGPQFSPDGSRVVFESTRTGTYEVWMCRSDGSELVQLTHLNSMTGTPRWSPDGREIAFDSRSPGNADIFVMDSHGNLPHQLTRGPSSDVVPSWSRDGGWIYFASDRTGAWQVWKIAHSGGSEVQVTRHGGFAPVESPDGKYLYYAKGLTLPGLWRVPVAGGEEVEIIGSLEPGYWGYWAVTKGGIYFLETAKGTNPGFVFFDLATHHTKRLFNLENPPAREAPGLAVSPDGRSILYSQIDSLSRDITLVDNFR